MSFVHAETEIRNGDIVHVYDDPTYLELLRNEREVQASIKAMDDENAKLRELVRGLEFCARSNARYCNDCPLCNGEDCTSDDRFDELGIEVRY